MIEKTNIHRDQFSGSYDLFKYIVKKYSNELPYRGSIIRTLEAYSYRREHHFDRDGVRVKIWNMLHKDLFIACLLGKMKQDNYKTLPELKEEFQKSQEKK